jgi:hypothetical protein
MHGFKMLVREDRKIGSEEERKKRAPLSRIEEI